MTLRIKGTTDNPGVHFCVLASTVKNHSASSTCCTTAISNYGYLSRHLNLSSSATHFIFDSAYPQDGGVNVSVLAYSSIIAVALWKCRLRVDTDYLHCYCR